MKTNRLKFSRPAWRTPLAWCLTAGLATLVAAAPARAQFAYQGDIPTTYVGKTISDALPSSYVQVNSGMTSQQVRDVINLSSNSSTIVFRGGTYRIGDITITRTVTLRAWPGEKVWLDGSKQVTSWTDTSPSNGTTNGPVWSTSSVGYEFPPKAPPEYTSPSRNPLADHGEMAFDDDVPQVQVSAASAITKVNQFAVDRSAHKLYIYSTSTPSNVYLSQFSRALTTASDATGFTITLRGLNFRRYVGSASTPSGGGATGPSAAAVLRVPSTIDRCTFFWNGHYGLLSSADNTVIEKSDFVSNGSSGILSSVGFESSADDVTVRGNLISYNNAEAFNHGWDAAGIKITRGKRYRVYDNFLEGNKAPAIWTDSYVEDSRIFRNYIIGSKIYVNGYGTIGIKIELSTGVKVAFNLVRDTLLGVQVWCSPNTTLFNNTLHANTQSVILKDEPGRIKPGGPEFRTTGADIRNNIFSDTKAKALPEVDEVLLNASESKYEAGNGSVSDLSSAQRISALDYNTYRRYNATEPANVVRWRPNSGTNITAIDYPNLGAFKTATNGYEDNGLGYDAASSNFYQSTNGLDFRPQEHKVERGGVALPTGISALMRDQTAVVTDALSGSDLPQPARDALGLQVEVGAPQYMGAFRPAKIVVAEGTYKLINRNSELAMEVVYASTLDGAGVHQFTDKGTTAQQWIITAVSDGYYKLINKNSGKALEVSGGEAGIEEGRTLLQWTSSNASSQQWAISTVSGGFLKLTARHSSKAIEVENASMTDRALLRQRTYAGGYHQQWTLVKLSDSTSRMAAPVSPVSVVSINRAGANPTTASSVDYTVTFSQSVSGVESSDFSLATTGSLSGAKISEVLGSDTTYTVRVSSLVGAGKVRLDVVEGATIFAGASALSGGFTAGQTYTRKVLATSSKAIISEFRFRGKNGAGDEFVEIYNPGTSPVDIAGWKVVTNSGTEASPVFVESSVPLNTPAIPPLGRYLFIGADLSPQQPNTGYSLDGYGTGDSMLSGGASDDSGVSLRDTTGAEHDAVGFASGDAALREGAGLPSAPTVDQEFAFTRLYGNSQHVNSEDSSADFVLVAALNAASTTALTPLAGTDGLVTPQQGAPNPQGTRDPAYLNGRIVPSLLDPGVSSSLEPNRGIVRVDANGNVAPTGKVSTLIIRRTLTNTTDKEVSRVRLSVTRITSRGSAGSGNPAQATVTLGSSSDLFPATGESIAGFTVFPSTLEANASGLPTSPLGGGLGSSVALSEPIPPGASRSYSFLLNGVKSGNYQIVLNIEGIPK